MSRIPDPVMHSGQHQYRLMSTDELLAMKLPETRTSLFWWVRADCSDNLDSCDKIPSAKRIEYEYAESFEPGMMILPPSDPDPPVAHTPEPGTQWVVLAVFLFVAVRALFSRRKGEAQ
jgi:hypothetical protein